MIDYDKVVLEFDFIAESIDARCTVCNTIIQGWMKNPTLNQIMAEVDDHQCNPKEI